MADDEAKSKITPNTFQTPNIYVDRLMPLLTDAELRILFYAVRRIMGFLKRTDKISISQFTDGAELKSGGIRDSGTGLGRPTAIEAVNSLVKYRVLVKVAENDLKKNEGAEYALNLDDTLIDFPGLTARWQEWQEKNHRRTATARQTMADTRLVQQTTQVSHTNHPQSVPQTTGGQSDKPTKASLKPVSTTPSAAGKIIDDQEALRYYQTITGYLSVPSIDHENTLRVLCDIAREYGDATPTYCKPFYIAYINTRSQQGTKYSPTGNGWLDWAATKTIPEWALIDLPANIVMTLPESFQNAREEAKKARKPRRNGNGKHGEPDPAEEEARKAAEEAKIAEMRAIIDADYEANHANA